MYRGPQAWYPQRTLWGSNTLDDGLGSMKTVTRLGLDILPLPLKELCTVDFVTLFARRVVTATVWMFVTMAV